VVQVRYSYAGGVGQHAKLPYTEFVVIPPEVGKVVVSIDIVGDVPRVFYIQVKSVGELDEDGVLPVQVLDYSVGRQQGQES
jgi:hypothetical protein